MHATVVRAQEPTSARAGRRRGDPGDGTIEGFVGGHVRREFGAGGRAGRPARRRRRAAAGAAGRADAVPGVAGRAGGGQPVPVRRGAGDLPASRCCRAPAVRRGRATPRSAERWPTLAALPRLRRSADGRRLRRARPRSWWPGSAGASRTAIRAALDAGVGFIALVASRTRGAAVLDELGLTDEERARVHTPGRARHRRAHAAGDRAVDPGRGGPRAIRVDGLAPGRRRAGRRRPDAGRRPGLRDDRAWSGRTPRTRGSTAGLLVLLRRLPRRLRGGVA